MSNQIFFGKVSDNKDPDELNLVRVTILGEQESVSNWLPVISPFAEHDSENERERRYRLNYLSDTSRQYYAARFKW